MECREYIRLLRAYRAANEHHTRLRDTLERSRGVLRFALYEQLLAQAEEARLLKEQTKSTLAMHLTLHSCAKAGIVTG